MANTVKYNDNNFRFPGDYRINQILLYNFEGFAVDISETTTIINIYQSLEDNFITGNILLFDTFGLTNRLPIIGQEFLEFKARNPFDAAGDEEVDYTTHRLQVYKKTTYKTTQNAQAIVLYFTSIEMGRNQRIRVSQTFNQSYGSTVNDIIKGKDYLNSKKNLFVAETKNNYKINIPNLRPIDAVNMLAERAEPKDHLAPGYLFFENNRGLHFRPLDDLYADSDGTPKPIKHYFDLVSAEQPSFLPVSDEILAQLCKPKTYEINNNSDSVLNTRRGMFANKVISHDLYNKTWNIDKYNYANAYYNDTRHVEPVAFGKYQGIMAPGPAELDDEHNEDNADFGSSNKNVIAKLNQTPLGNSGNPKRKLMSDYYDSRIMLSPNTKNLYDKNSVNGFNLPKVMQKREQILGMYNYLSINMDVPGNFTLNAGDLVYCDVPSFEAQEVGNDPNASIRIDPALTGRYLITDVHHCIDLVTRTHDTSIRVARDMFAQPFVPPNFQGSFKTPVYDPIGSAIDTVTLQSFKDITKSLKIPTPQIGTVEDITSKLGLDINTPIDEIRAAATAAGKVLDIDFNSPVSTIQAQARNLGLNVDTQINALNKIRNSIGVSVTSPIYGIQNAANTSINSILNSTTNKLVQNKYTAAVTNAIADRQNILNNILSKTTLQFGGINLPIPTSLGDLKNLGISTAMSALNNKINQSLNSFVKGVSINFKASARKVGSFIKGFF